MAEGVACSPVIDTTQAGRDPRAKEAESPFVCVLRSEQQAKADIARCRDEARVLLADARAAAEAVAKRAEARLTRSEERLRARLAEALAALESELTPGSERLQFPLERLDRAVARVAEELTTGQE